MKKSALLIIAIIIGVFTANAQIGGFVEKAAKKAAKKTEDKVVNKATDKASEEASKAIEEQMGLDEESTDNEVAEIDESKPLTYEDVMRQMPPLPTVQQMVAYKKAEFSGQSLKMLSSNVSKFQMSILELTPEVFAIQYQNADSAQIMDAAYKRAEMYTGLTKEEIDMLSTMSEEEQEAYLAEHYSEGRAEAALMEDALEASQYLEPLQPTIDRWTEVDNKVNKVYEDADAQCAKIYKKYASKLDTDDEKTRNTVLLKYYEEVAPIIRESVERGSKIRLNEQLPIAMEIEEAMIPIRAEHQDFISTLLNYAQLTASQYLTDALRICEIPEYPEDNEQ